MKTGKYIIVKKCTKTELKTILNDWLVMYVDGLRSKMIFEIAEINPTVFVLKVDENIDDTDFFYLVNYCAYPIGFKKTFEAEGHTIATKHKTLLNKNIYVFNNERENEKDKEYDNVWITTEENETYRFNFGGKFKKMDFRNNYKSLDINNLSIIYEKIIIKKDELLDEVKRKEDEKSRRSIAKRFKIISTILFVLIPLVFLINKHFSKFPDWMLTYSCSTLVAMWFIFDYKIFIDTKRTLICLLLSLLCVVFGINVENIFMATIATIPLSSVVIMWVGNKILGTKMDYLYDKLDRLFFLISIIIAVLISIFVFNPILKILK
ncbi:MAG: hypothetical protein FWF65_08830 [Bacteroidetes bacterium]|nr:hypothetical protein [Bacteroidota bacterium]